VKEIAWKAQHRLHRRYRRLAERGMPHQKVVTAVGRELLGFIWAVGVHVERQHHTVCPDFIHPHPLVPSSQRSRARRNGESSNFLCGRATARIRAVVRDSSRRITTMKAGLALDPRIAD
jgi:hypothetical protein